MGNSSQADRFIMTYEILWSLMSNFFFPISPFAPLMGLTQALHCSSAPSAALGQTYSPFFSHFLLGLATDLELRPAVTLPTAHRRAQPQGSRSEGRPAGPAHWLLLIEAALYRPLWPIPNRMKGLSVLGAPYTRKLLHPSQVAAQDPLSYCCLSHTHLLLEM